jgi:hypothetical protein
MVAGLWDSVSSGYMALWNVSRSHSRSIKKREDVKLISPSSVTPKQRMPEEQLNKNWVSSYQRSVHPFIIIVVLLSALVLVFHTPGSFTQDSMFTLNESLTVRPGDFDNRLSPIYSLIWKEMISAFALLGFSPFYQVSTMCVLQTVLIVGALIQLLRAHATLTWGQIAAVAAVVIASPAIFVYFGEIWRDVLMAALLLVSVALLDWFRQTESKKIFFTAIAVLFLAALTRQNCISAELPLFFWAGLLLYRATKRRYIYASILTAVLFVSFAAGWSAVNRRLASSASGNSLSVSVIMYYDLMGISARTGELLLPQTVTIPGYSLETVRSQYTDEIVGLNGTILPANAQEMRVLLDAWHKAILAYPAAYLGHRWFVTRRFLGISGLPHLPYHYGIPQPLYPAYIENRAYHVRFPSTRVRKWEAKLLNGEEYWAFRHWTYLTLALVVMFLSRRNRGTAFWLCLSALAYCLPDFFILPSTDFRYGWWSVLAATTGFAMLLAEKFSERQKHSPKARSHSDPATEAQMPERITQNVTLSIAPAIQSSLCKEIAWSPKSG